VCTFHLNNDSVVFFYWAREAYMYRAILCKRRIAGFRGERKEGRGEGDKLEGEREGWKMEKGEGREGKG